jgi:16S rRNA U516 pseudouridylate synthase RsuA-like enzyme
LLPDLSQLIVASAAITKQERSSQNDESSKNQQQQEDGCSSSDYHEVKDAAAMTKQASKLSLILLHLPLSVLCKWVDDNDRTAVTDLRNSKSFEEKKFSSPQYQNCRSSS